MTEHRLPNRLLLGLALLGWLLLLLWKESQTLQLDPLWSGYQFPWGKTAVVLGGFSLACLLVAVGSALIRHFTNTVYIASGMAAYVGLLASGADSVWAFQHTLILVIGFLAARTGQLSLLKLGYGRAALSEGFLVSAVVIHHALFLLASLGAVNAYSIGIVIFLASIPALLSWAESEEVASEWDLPCSIGILGLGVLLCLTTVAGTLPQTYTDGVVYRLPYARELLEVGGFPEHLSAWFRLIYQPITLLIVPGYALAGEQGAFAVLLLFTLALAQLIFLLLRALGARSTTAIAFTFAFLATPPVWLLSTVIYNDLALCAYSIATLLAMVRFRSDTQRSSLLAAGLFLGFAACIKLNALLVTGLIVGVYVVGDRVLRQTLLSRWKDVVVASLLAAVALGPWMVRVTVTTGNPLFPLAERFTRQEFTPTPIFTEDAKKSFYLELLSGDFLISPWNAAFVTTGFGEYLNGSFGFTLLLVLPFLVTLVSIRNEEMFKSMRNDALLLLSGAIGAYALMVASVHMPIFRYWLVGYAVLLVSAALAFDHTVRKLSETRTSITQPLIMFAWCFLHIGFLTLVGARLRYATADGLGDEVYFGRLTRSEYVDSKIGPVPKFIMGCTDENDAVLATGFTLFNQIPRKLFGAFGADALFGALASVESAKAFIEKNRIRYWIVGDPSTAKFLNASGISARYFRDERVVFSSHGITVYDLDQPIGGNPAKLALALPEIPLRWETPASIVEPSEFRSSVEAPVWATASIKPGEALKLSLSVRGMIPKGTVIVDLVYRDKDHREISREAPSRELSSDFFSSWEIRTIAPNESSSIQIIIRPWRTSDGIVSARNITLTTAQIATCHSS